MLLKRFPDLPVRRFAVGALSMVGLYQMTGNLFGAFLLGLALFLLF